ncbi:MULTISPECIES: Spy/CpxP family protein refolding chaperone [unclassified Saccharicrinis]|uniref:Spy/CpxP family protein refolding chaperone n=1 Tax=unclassified Saccharicrinis TaxID=2646859 RepID=UPI003D32910B
MEKKHYIIIIAVLVVLNIFSWRIWWESPRHRDLNNKEQIEKGRSRRSGDGGMSFFAERLKLTPAQQKDFEQLKKSYFKDVELVKDSMNAIRKRLVNTISESGDTASREILFKEMASYKLEMEQLTMQHFVNMRSICNDEQKQIFDKLIIRIMEHSHVFKEPGKSRGKNKRSESSERRE